MNKVMKAALITGLSLAVLAGCSEVPKNVETGGKNTVAADAPKEQGKRIKANFSKEFDGIKVNVAEIVIQPDKIQVGLNYENTNGKKVDWYPDQGQLVVGDMQLDVDPLAQHGLTTGTIAPGTKSNGVLTFIPPAGKKLDVNKVTEIQFHLNEIIPEDLLSTTKVDFNIPVK